MTAEPISEDGIGSVFHRARAFSLETVFDIRPHLRIGRDPLRRCTGDLKLGTRSNWGQALF